MIITRITSGLGNQMFQYACGKALALRNNDVLKLDITECIRTDMPLWKYRLGVFTLKEEFATADEIARIEFPHGKLSRFYIKLRIKLGLLNVGFMPRILKKKGDVFLSGFWQTEKYFKDFSDQIRSAFTLKDPLGSAANSILETIRKSQGGAISLHIRRADYATNTAVNKMYRTFGPEYYSNALAYISSKTSAVPHVFFFSDDIGWVKENVKLPCQMTYVSSPGIADHEELSLMSACDHHIISNSTFGWWGAWLDKKPQKIVVAPKKWTNKRTFIHRHTVPADWVRL